MKATVLQLLLILLVFCTSFIPRLLMIGAPPATDEGIYAFNALIIYLNPQPGNLLPELGTLSIYQALMAWVFSFDLNQFVLLRAFDALVASLTGLMLYCVTSFESNSKVAGAVIAVIFLITLNDPVFIQYGYKNSIFAASLPLLIAIAIGQRSTSNAMTSWFYVGALVAIAVMLREPFIVFAVVGVVPVIMKGGRVALKTYVLGGFVVGGLTLSLMILMRGGYQHLLQSYSDLALMFQEIVYQRPSLFKSSTATFAKNTISVLMLSAISIYWVVITGVKKPEIIYRLGFWLTLAIAPLLEPLLKNGYPYHYASTLFGLAGVVSLGWRVFSEAKNKHSPMAGCIVLLACLFLMPKLTKFNVTYKQYTAQFGGANTSIDWPLNVVRQSNYLLIAEHIHNNSHGNLTVAINGSMLGIIPLAKATPSKPELAHLSYRYIQINKDKERLKAEIEECPPEFIMLTNSSPFNDTKELNAIVKSIPEYQLSTYIPMSNARHYGSFDAAIYKWIGKFKDCRFNQQERLRYK